MWWDIALSLLAAFAQAVTGILGWRVAVDGEVNPKRQKMYEWLFITATSVGVVSVGLIAYRGTGLATQLANIAEEQKTANADIANMKAAVSHSHAHLNWGSPYGVKDSPLTHSM